MRSPSRLILVSAAIIAALAHVPLIAPHLRVAPYMGVLFAGLAVSLVLLAGAALLTDRDAVLGAALTVCSAAIVGYGATRLVAFPMLGDDVGNWLEPLGVAAVLSEMLVVAAALHLLALRPSRRIVTRRRAALTALTLTLPVLAIASTGTAQAGLGPNLVVNSSLETQTTRLPSCFQSSGYGSPATFSVATGTAAHSGNYAETITQNAWVSGDRKLIEAENATCAPQVSATHQYQASLFYKSTTPVTLTMFKHSSGVWSYYTDLKTLAASAGYIQAVALTPLIPAGVDQISFGVSLHSNGSVSTDDYALQDISAPAPPPSSGQGHWDVLSYPNTVRSVHSVLLNSGKVLFIAGSGNSTANFAAGTFKTTLWDPTSGQFNDIPTPTDLFCSGHVQLPNGNVLVMGGNLAYPAADGTHGYEGRKSSYIFNTASNLYEQTNDMNVGHWYPSATEMGNGNVVSLGGLNETSSGTVETELFNTASNTWTAHNAVPQTFNYWGLYPSMILMQDGRLFYDGSHVFGNQGPGLPGADIYNFDTTAITQVAGLQDPQERDQSGAVLLPPAQAQKVMIIGGGNVNTNVDANRFTDLIDLSSPNPTYTPGPLLPQGIWEKGNSASMSMNDPAVSAETGTQGKMYVSTVLLPNRTVLETGGALHNRADPVFEASIYNPASNSFTPVPADPVERQYHSESFLIPDGRVVSVGSNPGDGSFDMRISVYSPPYVGVSRPAITSVNSSQWAYGSTQRIVTDGPIASASLLKPAAVTHQSDSNQRLVDLPLSPNADGSYGLNLTSNANVAPPGYYMLTVQRADGTPSTASWVHLG